MLYYFTNNELENGTIADLHKLLSVAAPPDVVLHGIIQTETKGSFRVRYANRTYVSQLIDPPDMSDTAHLLALIQEAVTQDPAQRYGLVLSGHQSGWFLEVEPWADLSVFDLQRAIAGSSVHFSFVGFDGCLMSNLESAYQMRNYTDYIVACETYGPWQGLLSDKFLNLLSNAASSSVEDALVHVGMDFIQRNNYEGNDPADIAVLDTSQLPALVDLLRSFQVSDAQFNDSYALDPDDGWTLFDIYSTIQELSNSSQVISQSFPDFQKAYTNLVRFYAQNDQGINPFHHGLSWVRNTTDETPEHQKYYAELELSDLIVRSAL